jgi:hypothetical protein
MEPAGATDVLCKGQDVHPDEFAAPTQVEYSPAAQSVQATAPPAALYCPARHAVQATPSSAAVYPGTHWHCVTTVATSGEIVWAGHAWHVDPEP